MVGEESGSIQTIAWEPIEGAAQYRMVIRDDTIGEITNKDIISENSYKFDWGERDVQNSIRYRTQYRDEIDGDWIDMDRYRYIFPPGSSVLREIFGMSFTSDSSGGLAVTGTGNRLFSLDKMKELDEHFAKESEVPE